MKKKISIALRLMLITLLLFIVLELLFRFMFGPPPGYYSPIITDPVLNHKWKPNMTFTEIGRGLRPVTLYTNAQSWVGRNDVSVRKPKDTIRIFYMGDSNVEGAVPEGEKMVNIVERELNKRLSKKGKRVEIVNTGTSSWSPSLYYLLLKTNIIKYSPDLIVINVDMTDVRDDDHYKKLTKFDEKGLPLAVRPSDAESQAMYRLAPQGIIRISSFEQLADFLRKNFALYYDLEKMYLVLGKNNTIRKLFFKPPTSTVPSVNSDNWLSKVPSNEADKKSDYSMFILGNTIDFLRANDIKVVITGVPHYPQFSGEWSARPHQILQQTANKYKAPYLNSYEALKSTVTGSAQSKYYWDVDPTHFNKEGNRIWAEAQINFLLKQKDLL